MDKNSAEMAENLDSLDSPLPSSAGGDDSPSLGKRIRDAVIWRSGSQIVGQLIAWASTFVVIRILSPADYGLYAMTQVLMMLFAMLNGYGLASAVIQQRDVTVRQLRQVLGLLLLVNGGLAVLQFLTAPLAAAYYREPMVADLVRVQALIYLTLPFAALAYAQLGRVMEFRLQAHVNLASALIGAAVALGGALAGWGVWALVWAPIAMAVSRAIGLTIAARTWLLPLFDFRGAGTIARYGGLVAIGQIFAFIQTQADLLVAGRLFDAHMVGIYTTALFLTQIFNNKVIPPLNEVAFTAYSRIRHESGGEVANLGEPFARAVRAIMTAAMPFFLGLAVVAEPLVFLLLGEKWMGTVPIIHILAIAMPFWTIFTLFQPATDAMGRPDIALGNAVIGTVIMPIAFIVGARWGITGIAAAWIAAYPLLLLFAARRSLPVIGITSGAFVRAVLPPVAVALVMAASVAAVARLLPDLTLALRLPLLIAVGVSVYAAGLALFARETAVDLIAMIRGKALD